MEKNHLSEWSTYFQPLSKKLSKNLLVKTSILDLYDWSFSSYKVLVLSVKKKVSFLCLYVDFWGLNCIT